MSEKKYCVNCRHCVETQIPRERVGYVYVCMRPINDLVKGPETPLDMPCSHERATGMCGPDGVYYKEDAK